MPSQPSIVRDAAPTVGRLLLVLVAAATPAVARAQVVSYTITDLGSFGGTAAEPRAINGAGQIAGWSSLSGTNPFHAFRTTPTGRISDIGSDLGVLPGGTGSQASSINAAGQVTGIADIGGRQNAFRTTATGGLGDPSAALGGFSSTTGSLGMGINATGQVTGTADVPGLPIPGATHAFRTTATGRVSDPGTDLGVFPGGVNSFGMGINDSGQVAGRSEYAPPPAGQRFGPMHAFRTTALGVLTDPGVDLGTLGGFESNGYAINNAGQVVGDSYLAGNLGSHAFRSSPNGQPISLTDLGSLGGNSSAAAINSFGVVVGFDSTKGAFIYDTQMRDLNSLIPPNSGWVLGFAYAINDSGEITGTGTIGGAAHAFRLTPVAVPEPSGIELAIGAAISVCLWRKLGVRGRLSPSTHRGAVRT
jgi:probable HAF family extracellular repeat protein